MSKSACMPLALALLLSAASGPSVAQHLFDLKADQKAGPFLVLGDRGLDTPGEIYAEYTLEATLVLDNDTGQAAIVPQSPGAPVPGKSHWKLSATLEVEEKVDNKAELLRQWGGDAYQTPRAKEWTEQVPPRDEDIKFLRPFQFDSALNAYVGQNDETVHVHGLERKRALFWSLRVRADRSTIGSLTFRGGHKADDYQKTHTSTADYDSAEFTRLLKEDVAYQEAQAKKVETEYVPKNVLEAARQLLASLRTQSEAPELSVTHFGSDGVHGPLDFYIELKHRGRPVPDAPVRFDVTGQHKFLADEFLVLDPSTRKWREVTRNKIFGVGWDLAPRTDANGQIVLRFRGDFWRIKNLQPLPAAVRLEAEAPGLPGKPTIRAQAEAVVKHRLFARGVHYRQGAITYPEIEPGHRIKRITHGQWVHPGGNSGDLWRIYSLITLGYDGPFVPPRSKDGYFWMPLEPNTILQIDPHRRVANPSTARDLHNPDAPNRHPLAAFATSLEKDDPDWQMPVASAVGLEVEWLDGTAGFFFVEREEKENGLFVLLSPDVSTINQKRTILFIQQEAEQKSAEYVVKKVLRRAVGGQVAAAVEIGIMAYEVADLAFDVVQAIAIGTGAPYQLPNGGTFIRLRSEIGCLRNDDGRTCTLYCHSGSPAVFTPDGRAVEARPGEAIRFDVGGAVDPPVATPMPAALRDALGILNDPPPPAEAVPAPSVPPSSPTPPLAPPSVAMNVPKTAPTIPPQAPVAPSPAPTVPVRPQPPLAPPLAAPAAQVWTQQQAIPRVVLGLAAVSAGSPEAHRLGVETPIGAVLTAVHPDTAAERAGLKRGDVIARFDMRDVRCQADLEAAALKALPGTNPMVSLTRGQAGFSLNLPLGATAPYQPRWYAHPSGGFQLCLPPNWHVQLARDASDTTMDRLSSHYGEYWLYCQPRVESPPDVKEALRRFVESRLRQAADAQEVSHRIGAEWLVGTARLVRGERIYWHYHLALSFQGRLYTFQLLTQPVIGDPPLPPAVLDVLATIRPYRGPSS